MILIKQLQKQEQILNRKLFGEEVRKIMHSLVDSQEFLGLMNRQMANEIIDDYLDYMKGLKL